MEGFAVVHQPQFLQRGTGSCIYRAPEASVPQLSSQGVRDLALQVPYVLRCEVPDYCGSNGRKVHQTIADVADLDNVMDLQARCGAHQVKRIVQSTEAKVVGDIHAIIVAASQVSHSERLWNALQGELSNVQIFWGVDAPPELEAKNLEVVRHTLLRDAEYVKGDSVVDNSHVARGDPDSDSASMFLRMYNGDWSQPIVQHYCAGCHPVGDVQAVRDTLFATAFEVNLMLCQMVEPSLDDWQTCGRACGRASLGIHCHDLLPRSFVKALPKRSDMLPPSNDRSDSISAARVRIQKKTYRAVKTLTEPDQTRKVLLMTYVAWPLERLQVELSFLDSTGNGLFDACAYADDLNPFSKCRRSLIQMLRDGKDGELAPLFRCFNVDEHAELMHDVRAMILEFGAQVGERFKEYKDFPRRWARYYHPAADQAQKQETLDEFFQGRSTCCRREAFCAKVFRKFQGSPEQFMQDTDFERAMRVLIRKYRFTGMAMERLLASFRANHRRERGVEAERICAVGLLTQCLAAAGPDRNHPAFADRQALLEAGVPLKRARVERQQDTRRGSGWINFKRKKEAERFQSGTKLRGAEYYEWLRTVSSEWKAKPRHETLQEFDESRAAILSRRADTEGMTPVVRDSPLRTFIDEYSDEHQPVKESAFLELVQGISNCEGNAHPGFLQYEDKLRSRLLEGAWVADKGDIPDSRKFTRQATCMEIHPGFCARSDADILPQAQAATAALFEVLSQCKAGSAWLLMTRPSSGPVEEDWMFLCHTRFKNPKINLVCEAELVGRKLQLALGDTGSQGSIL